MSQHAHPIELMGRKLLLLSLAALVVFLLAISIGSWRLRATPADPNAADAVLRYVELIGGSRDDVEFRGQKGRCGYVSYRPRHAAKTGFVRFLVDEQGEVEIDSFGLLRGFEDRWKASPCWYPPARGAQ